MIFGFPDQVLMAAVICCLSQEGISAVHASRQAVSLALDIDNDGAQVVTAGARTAGARIERRQAVGAPDPLCVGA